MISQTIALCLAMPVALVAASILWCERIYGQIVPDNSLGAESSVVIPGIESDRIDGGAMRGANLFHSFSEFNVNPGASAYFTNPGGIENILSRVTGGNISNIFGTLGVLGNANLFLINPSGIVFGPNARLDLGGSFVGTTADSVVFGNGFDFSATNPEAPPLLTINIPMGLSLRENHGRIIVQGTGNNYRVDLATLTIIRDDRPVGLEVLPTETLALVGGEILLSGGNLTTAGGRVELWSVIDGSLQWNPSKGQFTMSNSQLKTSWGDIRLEEAASIDVSGSGGGNVQLQGRAIQLANNSVILAETLGNLPGGNITVRGEQSVELIDTPFSFDSKISNLLFAGVGPKATGDGGNISIETQALTLRGFAAISTITIAEATGNAGNLSIEAKHLTVGDGSQITSATFGPGNAGSVSVLSEVVELSGGSDLQSGGIFVSAIDGTADGSGIGSGGNLTIIADQIIIRDGATVNASNFHSLNLTPPGKGPAGNIEITASELRLEEVASITASAAVGEKGNITISSQQLLMVGESDITTNARGEARGGNIEISTDTLVAMEDSDISANAEQSVGDGGNLTINADTIALLSGSNITANAVGGDGGNISITAMGLFSSNDSAITASSELGVDGVVSVDTPDTDPTQGLIELSNNVVDAASLIGKDFCALRGDSSFTIVGRGGLPSNPTEVLDGNNTLVSWVEPVPPRDVQSGTQAPRQSENSQSLSSATIVPARGWILQEDGSVRLVGYDPTLTGTRRLPNAQSCRSKDHRR